MTNSKLRMVAHLNFPARLMDSGLRSGSGSFTVFQNGEQVFLSDVEGAKLGAIDVSKAELASSVDFSGFTTTVGGSTLAVADSAAGKVWIQSAETPSPINPDEQEAQVEDMPGALVAIGMDGSAHVASPVGGKWVSIVPRGELASTVSHDLDAEHIDPEHTMQIAAIGEDSVLFDRDESRLFLPNGTSQVVEGTALILQESGPESDVVLLASDQALIEVPLRGGDAVVHANSEASGVVGVPSRPMRHLGCSYGAWSGSGAFLRQCDNDADTVRLQVDDMKTAEEAVFRVNRDVIVLNDVNEGDVWLPDAQMMLVDNWDQIESSIESEEESDEDSPDQSLETLLPERSEKNTPPEAVDDEFGVRAGRSSILPVIANDSDIDGDFLTASVKRQPSFGQVSVARDGAALQVSMPQDAQGSTTFEYELSDGRGGTAQATVTLSVRAPEVNDPPKQLLVPSVSLGTGRHLTMNALANWYDPDGDPFYLDKIQAPAGISARSHVNGSLDLAEIGHGPGKDVVHLYVSDGRDIGEGSVNLTVKESGNEPPQANADHIIVREGSSVTFSPLSNDIDPNGDSLRLVQIDQASAGITASMDGNNGVVTVVGTKVGTYYLGYVVTDGPATGQGYIRIDVVPEGSEAPPSAEPDLGVLPEGGQVLIDLLSNDSDPTGGVLTVQKIDVPQGSPLLVALINHQIVRVSAPRGLSSPQTFSYTVTNGVGTASATVTVVPKEAPVAAEPPEVHDDQLVVRAGDIASVAVLANDRSPSGLKLTVSNDLQHEIRQDLASVFISDNIVRVRGGSRAGSGKIVYTVHDTAGNVASGVVNLVVVGIDEENNSAPRPRDLTVRTIAGQSVDIHVPLDNIDPDGDSVTLVGIASVPRHGSVRLEGSKLIYESTQTAKGTDSFTYLVEDRLGKQATAMIRVGITPRAEVNQPPVAVPDQVMVRPGTKVAVAVTANDLDPDGDKISLEKESISTQSENLTLLERSGRIVVQTPDSEGTHVVSYGITDGRGGKAQGVLNVVVRKEAPELAPIARDDQVTTEDVAKAKNNKVEVAVLDNDEDPDGDIEAVKLSSEDAAAVPTSRNTVEVTLTDKPQLLIYSITDASNKKASAVIRVPGIKVERPTLDPTTQVVRVKAGEQVEIPINDYITTRDGRQVIITSENKVSAGIGHDGSPLVKDQKTLMFRADEKFSGNTSITLEVTDGKDLNESDGVTAIVSIPVVVEPKDNQPPVLTPTGVTVVPGEAATTVNLAAMVTDPDGENPASMSYRLEGDTPGEFQVTLSGSTLSVAAGADVPKGTKAVVRVSVEDSRAGKAEGDIPLTVASSSRPLAQVTEAQVTLDAGKSTSVDVSQYATNPFADKGGLAIVGAPSASEGGSASHNGTTITVSANEGFNGTFTVGYTLEDATKDPDRTVRGVITATVRDKPGAPIDAAVVSNSSGTAQVSWKAGPANGTPITGFTVTDHTQGDSKECGLVTTCLMEGRRNGIEHTFSVTATNEVGVSDPSNQTSTVIDIEPEAPAAPLLSVGDRQVTVTWAAPHNEGTALVEYEVTLSPVGTQVVSASTTSTTFTGLANGAEYKATVRARNSKGWSPQSSESRAGIPYGAPGPVSGLQASYSQLGAGDGAVAAVDVSWTAAHPNGRAIEYYIVTGPNGVTKKVTGGATSTSMEGIGFSTNKVEFTVRAVNDGAKEKDHISEPSTTSVWVLGRPVEPTQGSVKATGQNNQLLVQGVTGRADRGWTAGDLQIEWRTNHNGQWQNLPGNGIITGLNGSETTVEVRAVGNKDGVRAESEPITVGTTSAFGAPSFGGVHCESTGAVGQVVCSWGDANGAGRDIRVELTGNTTKTVKETRGSETFNVGEGATARLCAQAIQSSPELGERKVPAQPVCSEATGRRKRTGTVRTLKDGEPTGPFSPCRNNCQFVKHELSGWEPNTDIKCTAQLTDSAGKHGTWTHTARVNGDGYWLGAGQWSNGSTTLKLVYNATQYDGRNYFDSISCNY